MSIPLAVAGNFLVLAAIWRNPFLRTNSYILLAVLASTDFLTGMIIQPFYVESKFSEIRAGKPQLFCVLNGAISGAVLIERGVGLYLTLIKILTSTCMAVERWLHMACRSLLTVRRLYMVIAIVLIFPIPLVAFRLRKATDCYQPLDTDAMMTVIATVCLSITSVAYFKVYQIILRHKHQVQANVPAQNLGQPAIDLAKFRRSVCTILCILAIFYIAYIPILVLIIVLNFVVELTPAFHEVFNALIALNLLSSSVNPFLYCLRMKDIRDGVMQIVKKMVCKN